MNEATVTISKQKIEAIIDKLAEAIHILKGREDAT